MTALRGAGSPARAAEQPRSRPRRQTRFFPVVGILEGTQRAGDRSCDEERNGKGEHESEAARSDEHPKRELSSIVSACPEI